MGSIAILTDSTVQFTLPTFGGHHLIRIIPLQVAYGAQVYEYSKGLKPGDLPLSVGPENHPRLIPPSLEQLCEWFSYDEMGQPYDQVIGIFSSSGMSGMVDRAIEAQKIVNGRTSLQTIDSQTTSIGLGMLVQSAAEAVARGANLADTERLVRSMVPHIYAVICAPGLSYLHYSGFLDRAQASVGEMLGLFPIFAFEEGQLTPLEKVRNHRQVLDFFQEFLEEFDQLQYVSFLQSAINSNSQDGRILRDHTQDRFVHTPFSEHTINLPVATLFGPNAIGLFVVEPPLR